MAVTNPESRATPDGAARVTDARNWVTRSRRRQFVTAFYRDALPTLRGRVIDVGGGRRSPHDVYWNPDAWRVRVDLSMTHRPDVCGDVTNLPFGDGSVDGVLASEIFEHLTSPTAAAAEIHRVLRPGGVLLGTVPFIYPLHADPDDCFRYTEYGLRAIFAQFAEVEVTPHGNALGAAWTLLSLRYRWLRLGNPLMRRIKLTGESRCPEGYAFRAVR